jgi:hypothetical protein
MSKSIQSGRQKPAKAVVGKARAGHSASVMKPEYLAEIERFRLMDDDFMSKCLENAPECIELMLQIILGKKDLRVVKSQTEYPIKSLQGRGVRFDVFARDSEGKEYDIEIQRADKGAEPKRARYNSALMDANALKTGEDVAKLRVIFITENDVIGGDKEIYQIDRMIRDLKCRAFGDGAHIIYVNGATRSASDIGRLVHDLLCSDAAKMYFDVLRKQVSQFKNSEEGRHAMCKAMEKIEARGERKNMLATAKRMLKDGILALKDIARYSGLSLAEVKKLQAAMA